MFQIFNKRRGAYELRDENGRIKSIKTVKPKTPFKGVPIRSTRRAMKPKTRKLRRGLKKRL